jgi:HAD superfamily hydrolase (TIGR01484 family)
MPVCERLLLVDLDGTLLDARSRVLRENVAALDRARAAGFEIVVATGRSWLESRRVLEAIGPTELFIGAGGAILHESGSGRVILRRTVGDEIAARITECVLAHGHLAHLLQDGDAAGTDYLLVGDARIDPASEWWFRTHAVRVRRHPTPDGARPFDATVRVGTVAVGDELEPLAAALNEELGPSIVLQHWSAQTATEAIGSRTHLLECFAAATNKWTMSLEVCALRGIGPEATVAVGDGLNDLNLIASAGFGIAMGNADPRVAAVARASVGHHDRGGFVEAISIALSLV